MRVYQENYGEDADGNRGEMRTFYELEDTKQEREDIAEILYEGYVNSCGVSGTTTIELEGVEIEVNIEEYQDELMALAEADENLGKEDLKILKEEVENYGK